MNCHRYCAPPETGAELPKCCWIWVPMINKNIHEVMTAQHDLVTILGRFDPKLVRMAPHGARAED
jgi:tRNA-splicing ligase RtcB